MLGLGLSDNIRGPLFADLLNFFSVSNSMGSLSFAFASMAALSGTLLSTLILKKINLDRLLSGSILLMGLGLFTMSTVPTYYLFLAGTLIYGLSIGTMGVAQNLLIAENIEQSKQPKVFSGLHGIYGFSSLLAPFLASRSPAWFQQQGVSVAVLVGWRSAFFITALICMSVFILIMLTRSEPQFQQSSLTESSNEKIKDKKAITLISIFFASYVGAEILVATRLALYMRTYFNYDLEQSSNYVTYFFVFLLVGRLFFTFKALPYKLKNQLSVSLVLAAISVGLGLSVHPFFLTLTGLFMAPFYPMSVAYIAEMTGHHKRTYLTSAMATQSLFVIFMHIGVGYLTDAFGLFYAFGICLLLLALSLACLNLHPQVKH